MENQMQTVKRPWQGTTWAWMSIIGTVILTLFAIALFFGFVGMGMVMENELAKEGLNPSTFMMGLSAIVFILFVPLLILEILLIVGFFKGWKWAVIVAIIFESLGILSMLVSFKLEDFIYLLLGGFMLYLAIACLQDPFYNKKS